MTQDADFYDGFDTYGPAGFVHMQVGVINPDSSLIMEWTGYYLTNLAAGSSLTPSTVASLSGPGQALKLHKSSSTNSSIGISKTLANNYARLIGGATLQVPAFSIGEQCGVVFGDAGTDQIAIGIESSGQITFRRGGMLGTIVATSIESIVAGVSFVLEWDVTIHASAGIIKVWLNGVLTSLNLTAQNTRSTANNTANQFRAVLGVSAGGGAGFEMIIDHLYGWFFLASGGAETPALTNPVIETQFATSDSVKTFAFGAAMLGLDYTETATTSAPGANFLFLRQYTPDVGGTLNSVAILPQASSAIAKFKAVAYADSAGAPAALLSSGTEVIGCTAGVALAGALVTPQTLVAGTPVWIGFIADTSIVLGQVDTGILGRKIANTYASGAPGTAGAMTAGQPSWVIYGLVSGVATNWSLLDDNPFSGDLSYVYSSSAGDEDLYNFPALVSTPTTIYGVAVKIIAKRSDAGARTMDMRIKSAATTGSGLSTGLTPATSYGSLASYFRVDPDTTAAWNASGVNSAKSGFKIVT